jgi:hypothetical protein
MEVKKHRRLTLKERVQIKIVKFMKNKISMKSKLLLYLMLIVNFLSHGQLTVDWAKSTGGVDSDFGYTLQVDSNNNVFIAGQFRGDVSFDPNSSNFDYTSGQSGDVFVQKYNEDGDFLWSKIFLNQDTSERPILVLDSDDNLYLSSTFLGSIDLDPGLNTDIHTNGNNLRNTYIVKLNNNGDYIWGKTFETISASQYVISSEIAVDNNDNILITGEFQGSVDFDFDPNSSFNVTSTLAQNGYILKIDSDGDLIWVKQISGAHSRIYFSCLEFDSQNNIIAGGAFTGTTSTDFDPSNNVFNLVTPNHSTDLFILKLTEDGGFLWVKKAEGYHIANNLGSSYANDRVHSLAIDSNDDIILVGAYSNIINFDTSSTSFILDSGINNGRNGFMAKMDSVGNMVWLRKVEGNNFAASTGNSTFYEQDILIDFNENLDLFLGYGFRGDLEYQIDGIQQSYQGNINLWQMALFQINPVDGDFFSAHAVGNDTNLLLNGIVFKGNDLYATGRYGNQMFFDLNTSLTATNNPNSSAFDAFTVKYENVVSLSIDEFNTNNVDIFPNPTKSTLNIKSKTTVSNISIYDLNGRSLKTERPNTNDFEYQLNVNDLSNGIYLLEVQSGNSKQIIKFIKN